MTPLEAALAKLEGLSGDIFVFIAEPIVLETVRACVEEETPMRFRYAKAGADAVTERVIEPYKVFQSGWWYVAGKDLGDGEVKYFRVDRMLSVEMTKLPRFTPPADVEVFDRVQVQHLLQRVTVRVPDGCATCSPTTTRSTRSCRSETAGSRPGSGCSATSSSTTSSCGSARRPSGSSPSSRRDAPLSHNGCSRPTTHDHATSRPRDADARVHGAERVHQH